MLISPLIIAPLLVVAVLIASGLAKLKEPEATQSAFGSLQMPEFLLKIKAPMLLPWGELALAALIMVSSGIFGVIVMGAAEVLLLLYVVIIARALSFPYPPECGCFGQLGLGLVKPRTLGRNILLAAIGAGAVIWRAVWPEDALWKVLGSADAITWGWVFAVIVSIVLTWLIVGGSATPMPRPRTAGQTPGSDISAADAGDEDEGFAITDIPPGIFHDEEDNVITWAETASAGPVLVVKIMVGCGPCQQVAEALQKFVTEHDDFVRVRIVVTGEPHPGVRETYPELVPLFDQEDQFSRVFQLANPGAMFFGPGGRILGGPARGSNEVLDFIADIEAEMDAARAAQAEIDAQEELELKEMEIKRLEDFMEGAKVLESGVIYQPLLMDSMFVDPPEGVAYDPKQESFVIPVRDENGDYTGKVYLSNDRPENYPQMASGPFLAPPDVPQFSEPFDPAVDGIPMNPSAATYVIPAKDEDGNPTGKMVSTNVRPADFPEDIDEVPGSVVMAMPNEATPKYIPPEQIVADESSAKVEEQP